MSLSSLPPKSLAAVIPAAGIGQRMLQGLATQQLNHKPKQYLAIAGEAMLVHSLRAIQADPRIQHIYVALHADDTWFDDLALPTGVPVTCVAGGESRAASVAAGVAAAVAAGFAYVAVHDAARPCLTPGDLTRVIDAGLTHAAGAVLGYPVQDTLKRASTDNYSETTVARASLWHAMTPQVMPGELLQNALVKVGVANPEVTDEASVIELCGLQPLLVEGSATNIKVTRADDLALAEWLLARQLTPTTK